MGLADDVAVVVVVLVLVVLVVVGGRYTQALTNAKCHYGLIEHDEWFQPDWYVPSPNLPLRVPSPPLPC